MRDKPSLFGGTKRSDPFAAPQLLLPTASVLIRELPLDYVAQPASWPEAHPGPNPAAPQRRISNPLVQMEKEKMTLGKPRDFPRCGLCACVCLLLALLPLQTLVH